jgi:thiol:disulfide interchange protein DsbA
MLGQILRHDLKELHMSRILRFACLAFSLLAVSGLGWSAQTTQFREGQHFVTLPVKQATQIAPGKVEVAEVFSYGCPACNRFQPTMARIKAALPKNAELAFVHASWLESESWPLFQRAYLAAKALGIAEKSHEAMFAAVWGRDGPLAIVDARTDRLKKPQPTIGDVARFHAQRGDCTEAEFLAAAKSFTVTSRMKQSDELIKRYAAPSTPCLVIGGCYRIEMDSVKSDDELIALVRYLVQKAAA